MLKTALIALPLALAVVSLPDTGFADPVRTGKTLKRKCLSEAQITAKLKRRGFRPAGKLQRRGNTYSVLTRRENAARR
ncbi:MAG: hypothetical protein ACLFV8_13420, partial [Alphaproteobacteria bacterium]